MSWQDYDPNERINVVDLLEDVSKTLEYSPYEVELPNQQMALPAAAYILGPSEPLERGLHGSLAIMQFVATVRLAIQTRVRGVREMEARMLEFFHELRSRRADNFAMQIDNKTLVPVVMLDPEAQGGSVIESTDQGWQQDIFIGTLRFPFQGRKK